MGVQSFYFIFIEIIFIFIKESIYKLKLKGKFMKDFLGNKIKKNSYISYPGRQGSSLWMNVAKVNKINNDNDTLNVTTLNKDFWNPKKINTRKATISRIDNVVIVSETSPIVRRLSKAL